MLVVTCNGNYENVLILMFYFRLNSRKSGVKKPLFGINKTVSKKHKFTFLSSQHMNALKNV